MGLFKKTKEVYDNIEDKDLRERLRTTYPQFFDDDYVAPSMSESIDLMRKSLIERSRLAGLREYDNKVNEKTRMASSIPLGEAIDQYAFNDKEFPVAGDYLYPRKRY